MLKKRNPDNERLKHRYLTRLREAKGRSVASVDAVAKALSRFEAYTKYSDFKTFRPEQASAFKRHLAEQLGQRSGEPLSKATLHSTVNALRSFFEWLSDQPGYKRCFTYSDAEYFTLLAKDVRIATARREREGPTLDQIARVIDLMPYGSEIEQRDRALIAFTVLTGARDSAIASLKLKDIDLSKDLVEQDARHVRTKASKTFTTWFFPVADVYRQIVADWVEYLRREKLWGFDDPLFPRTRVEPNSIHEFAAAGLEREHWSSASPIRKIFAAAFERAGLPYFHPHAFRNTLVRLGEDICRSPEQFKAWSQNLGHEHVLTTFTSYGAVARNRQAEIFTRELRGPQKPPVPVQDLLRQLAEAYRGNSVAIEAPPEQGQN